MPDNNDYISKVHTALSQKVDGFTMSEEQFREKMTDNVYREKVRGALTQKIEGFSLNQNDFEAKLGIKKKAESSVLSGGSDVPYASGQKPKGFADIVAEKIATVTPKETKQAKPIATKNDGWKPSAEQSESVMFQNTKDLGVAQTLANLNTMYNDARKASIKGVSDEFQNKLLASSAISIKDKDKAEELNSYDKTFTRELAKGFGTLLQAPAGGFQVIQDIFGDDNDIDGVESFFNDLSKIGSKGKNAIRKEEEFINTNREKSGSVSENIANGDFLEAGHNLAKGIVGSIANMPMFLNPVLQTSYVLGAYEDAKNTTTDKSEQVGEGAKALSEVAYEIMFGVTGLVGQTLKQIAKIGGREAMEQTAKAFGKEVVKRYGMSVGGEEATEVTSILIDVANGKEVNDIPKRLLDTFISSMAMTGAFHGIAKLSSPSDKPATKEQYDYLVNMQTTLNDVMNAHYNGKQVLSSQNFDKVTKGIEKVKESLASDRFKSIVEQKNQQNGSQNLPQDENLDNEVNNLDHLKQMLANHESGQAELTPEQLKAIKDKISQVEPKDPNKPDDELPPNTGGASVEQQLPPIKKERVPLPSRQSDPFNDFITANKESFVDNNGNPLEIQYYNEKGIVSPNGFVPFSDIRIGEISVQEALDMQPKTTTPMGGVMQSSIDSQDENSEEVDLIGNELNNTYKVFDVIDKEASINGENGIIKIDGQTVVFETDNRIYELGNVNEIQNNPIKDFGISVNGNVTKQQTVPTPEQIVEGMADQPAMVNGQPTTVGEAVSQGVEAKDIIIDDEGTTLDDLLIESEQPNTVLPQDVGINADENNIVILKNGEFIEILGIEGDVATIRDGDQSIDIPVQDILNEQVEKEPSDIDSGVDAQQEQEEPTVEEDSNLIEQQEEINNEGQQTPIELPKKIFHATNIQFEGLPSTQTENSKVSAFGTEPAGVFYSTNTDLAKQAIGNGVNARVIEAEFNPKNPLVITSDSNETYSNIRLDSEQQAIEELNPAYIKEGIDLNTLEEGEIPLEVKKRTSEIFSEKLIEQGYDSVFNQKSGDIIVLDPSAVLDSYTVDEADMNNVDDSQAEIEYDNYYDNLELTETEKEILSKIDSIDDALNEDKKTLSNIAKFRLKDMSTLLLKGDINGLVNLALLNIKTPVLLKDGVLNNGTKVKGIGVNKKDTWITTSTDANKAMSYDKLIDLVTEYVTDQVGQIAQNDEQGNASVDELVSNADIPNMVYDIITGSKEDVYNTLRRFTEQEIDTNALMEERARLEEELANEGIWADKIRKETPANTKLVATFASMNDGDVKAISNASANIKDIFHNFENIIEQLGFKKDC